MKATTSSYPQRRLKSKVSRYLPPVQDLRLIFRGRKLCFPHDWRKSPRLVLDFGLYHTLVCCSKCGAERLEYRFGQFREDHDHIPLWRNPDTIDPLVVETWPIDRGGI